MDYYDILLARKLSGGGGSASDDISSKAWAFYSQTQGQTWNINTQTASFTGSGTSSWPGIVLQNLKYKYSEISDRTFTIKATVNMSGYSSGSGIVIGTGVYTSANPVNNGSDRKASKSLTAVKTNGTTEVNVSMKIADMFTATGIENYYFGVGILINANSGTTCTVSNISMEIV